VEDQESKYFKMGEALDDVKLAYGVQDTAVSTLKFLGKGIFNVGRFAVAEVLPSVMEKVATKVEQNPSSSDEQLEKARELREKAAERRENYK
jgi:hypothetical protein